MSSYFDKASGEIRDCRKWHEENKYFEEVKKIENRVIRDCLEDSRDDEFPADLRNEIMQQVSKLALGYENIEPSAEGRQWLHMMKYSQLVENLHSIYHKVATLRKETRFGLLFDNPLTNLGDKENWSKEMGSIRDWEWETEIGKD